MARIAPFLGANDSDEWELDDAPIREGLDHEHRTGVSWYKATADWVAAVMGTVHPAQVDAIAALHGDSAAYTFVRDHERAVKSRTWAVTEARVPQEWIESEMGLG